MTQDRIPVVLHAHFYQPPRDNPWTESVDREWTAAPFHDWNERIEAECYGANTHARVFGESGRVVDIVNNYAHLHFNVGPTLFSWLESKAPYTYARILEADRASCRLHDGHGGAIAQAYSHAILPLCNDRDRDTQIRWGIADFRYRFGRAPEAMWLPETACDLVTADALARHGMRYVILSPHQAKRVRDAHSGSWRDVSDGSVDPRRPYRLALREGRSITCFFYDGPIAHAMSFEAMLDTSRGIAQRLRAAALPGGGSNQLIHVATDGETYGHHKRHADRSLAYFVRKEAEAHGLRLTTYGAHLDRVSVDDEVELKDGEGTAWSCAHGLGRWIRDCGCNAGRQPGFRQGWRGPLREALNGLRDDAARIFEDLGENWLRDAWGARDEYIEVVLRCTPEARGAFLARHARPQLSSADRVRVFELMEAQRMTQLMYASCGWFFDDLAGLETTQIMKYAGMAARLLESASGRPALPAFLERLSLARSNIQQEGNGADIFLRHVTPGEVSPKRRVARFASSTLFGGTPSRVKDPAYEIETLDRVVFAQASHQMVVGRVHLRRTRTERATAFIYGAAALPERDMHCGVIASDDEATFEAILRDAQTVFEQPSTPRVIRLIDRHLGPDFFSVRELSDAGRAEFIEHMVTDLIERLGATYGYLYDEHRRTMEAFERAGTEVPRELRMVAEYTLARRLDAAVMEAADPTDPGLVRTAKGISRQARELGIKLVAPRSASRLQELLARAAELLEGECDVSQAEHTIALLSLTEVLGVQVAFDRLQDVVLELLRGKAVASWPKDLRERLARQVGVEVATSDATP
jgi:alpha-amylase/alpha-mannosidase (GH57 family)